MSNFKNYVLSLLQIPFYFKIPSTLQSIMKLAVIDCFQFFFQWLVSLCRKMVLVYIRQVHVIGTILQMEVVQSDGKTKLCTVLCQFLDWPFKTNKIITHNLPTMHCFYWLKHTLFLPSINVKKDYSLKMSFFINRLKTFLTLPEFDI